MSFETKDHNNSKFAIFLNNSRFTYLLLAALVLTGTFALFDLDIESNPEINQPIGIVQTFYPNSSAVDVESSVTKPLEEEIAGLNQLKEISSNSSNNLSSITVTFESSADPKEAIDNLREAVSNASGKIASDAETPRVIELDFNGQSIVSLSVVGDADTLELTRIADEISDKINKIPGVSKTETSGDAEQLIQIELDPVRLEAYNISLAEVINVLSSSNINAPLGAVTQNTDEVSLRLIGKITQLEQLQNLAIRGSSTEDAASFITLADIAYIELAPETQKTLSKVGDKTGDPKNSVTINVFKSKGGNIINIVNTIDAEILTLNESLPEGVEIIKTNDNAFFIKTDIANLGSNGYQTMIIIFFSLLIFLTYREAFVAAIAVPIIFLMTFAILYFTGQTLNGLTIFSLILSLGLIVDTSIVIVEGIHEYRNEGYSKIEAAKKSLATYSIPLVSGTLTTLAAFAPMLLVSGIVGEYIKTIPIVLLVTLFSSLFVSFVFTPILGSQILKSDDPNRTKTKKEELIGKLKELYETILRKILSSSKLKKTIVAVLLVLFVLSMAMPVTGVLKAQLFPTTDTPFLYINVEAANGSSLDQTAELAEPITSYLNNSEYVKNYVFNIGTQIDVSGMGGGTTIKSNYGHLIVNLIDDESARPKSFEIASDIRKEFENLADIKVTIVEVSAGPPSSAPLDIQLIGPDLETLKQISFDLKDKFEQVDGLVNVKTDFDNLSDELSINLDQEKLRYFGVSNQQVALLIQAYTNGIETGKVEFIEDEYDIKVYLDNSESKNAANLESLPISTATGNIPLAYLGTIDNTPSIQFIPRIDQERSAKIQASTDEGILFADIKPVTDEIIANYELPEGYSFDLGGEDEDIQESFTDLFNSMFIAVVLILVILVVQFNSFRQTFLILGTIPLAVIGIFPGLALLGLPLSFPAFLGIVMLAGIVVNDAIVLIDQMNYNRKQGIEIYEAVVEASTSRLVPVILTSITTILGLLPLAITDEFWRGLGFSVVFGLTTATFLTLFVIPMFYLRFYKKNAVVAPNPVAPETKTDIITPISNPVADEIPEPFNSLSADPLSKYDTKPLSELLDSEEFRPNFNFDQNPHEDKYKID